MGESGKNFESLDHLVLEVVLYVPVYSAIDFTPTKQDVWSFCHRH